MARISETFTIPRSQNRAAEICRGAFNPIGWRYMDDQGWAFLVRERLDVIQLFYKYPVKFAVFVRADGPRKANVEIHAHTFGIGPLPKRTLRKYMAEARRRIEAEL